MSNSGPSTDKFPPPDATQTHADPVDFKGERVTAVPEALGAAPGRPVTTTSETVTKKVSKRPAGEPKDDQDLKQKLLAAGAIVAAGVAIVLGVRHFRGEDEPQHEETAHLFKRKAKQAKHKAHDAGNDAGGESKNLLEEAGEKVHSVASATGDKAKEAYDAAAEKAAELQQEAKDKVEHETKKADAKAASPAVVEQRRMTYGQDDSGRPKGPVKDAGFLGFRNWFPGAKGDSV